MDATSVIEALGRDMLANRLGVTQGALREAARRGTLPAAWWRVARDLGRERNVAVPEHVFGWKGAAE